jgi:2-desacetyl-2-hydroxyethyl bacteriochlorophyllide A dehydrogenase
MQTMKAVWLENNSLSYRDDVKMPEPLEGEALVKVRLAGICATDLELVKGYYPFIGIPGHEFVGEIIQAPAETERVGERVVGSINVACGSCNSCLAGRTNHCERRSVLGIASHDGAFAEYLCLPLINLKEVPDTVPDEAAVFVEPLAAALQIQEQIRISGADNALIVGAGRLGQLIAQTLVLTGCKLQVAARHPKQRELLAERNIPWIDETAIPQRAFDIVVEATGSADGFGMARNAVRPRGTIVIKSTYKGNLKIDFSSIVVDEITITGSRCGPFTPALRLLDNRLVDPTILIEERFPLNKALEAYERAAAPGSLKVILQIADSTLAEKRRKWSIHPSADLRNWFSRLVGLSRTIEDHSAEPDLSDPVSEKEDHLTEEASEKTDGEDQNRKISDNK